MIGRILIGSIALVFVIVIAGTIVPVARTAYATDPTLDAAIYQATVRAGQTSVSAQQTVVAAQQTRDAREQNEANQRGTASALDNAIKSQNATSTAQAQARDAAATQVARTATASFVQTQDAARATANAQATRSAQATQMAQAQATATASAVSAQQTRASIDATVAVEQLRVDATRTALQTQLRAEERDAAVRSMLLVLGGIIALVMLIVGGAIALRALWQVTSVPVRSASNTVPEQEPSVDIIDVTPTIVEGDLNVPHPFGNPTTPPETLTQIAYSPDATVNAQTTQATLELIARQLEEKEHDSRSSPTLDGSTV